MPRPSALVVVEIVLVEIVVVEIVLVEIVLVLVFVVVLVLKDRVECLKGLMPPARRRVDKPNLVAMKIWQLAGPAAGSIQT